MTTNEPDGVPPVPSSPSDAPPATPTAPAAPSAPSYGPATPAQEPYGAQQPYGSQQQPYGAAPYQAYPPALPKGLSITAMVTGIAGVLLGFVGWGFLPALAGVIFGHIAQRREPHAKPFWLTGIITGYVGLGLSLLIGLLIAAAIFLPLFIVGTTSGF